MYVALIACSSISTWNTDDGGPMVTIESIISKMFMLVSSILRLGLDSYNAVVLLPFLFFQRVNRTLATTRETERELSQARYKQRVARDDHESGEQHSGERPIKLIISARPFVHAAVPQKREKTNGCRVLETV